MRAFPFFVALVATAAHSWAANLEALLANPKLWTLTQDEFMKLPESKGFEWTSAARDSARAGEQKLELYKLPIVEVVVRFDGGKVVSVTPIIYARGDVGGMPKEKFTQLVTLARDTITAQTKVPVVFRGKDASSAVKADGFTWATPGADYLLEYSFTKEVKSKGVPFRAEFVRLELQPPAAKVGLLAAVSASTKKFSGPQHIKRDTASGDVVIPNVPMVDQGQKGYCAVACTERLGRYYGVQMDANEIAQVANSDASGGTSGRAMIEALKKLSTRLKLRVRPIEEPDVRQLESLMADYNRAAKKGSRAPQIPDQGRMLDVAAIYHAMDPGVLKEVRTKNKSDLARFQTDIQKHIDQGIPLLWSVMLGIIKEKEIPQADGGHMRLIIGYNVKTQEIMYTDSWGAGHEMKRMPLPDAWTMTTGLTAIEPM